MASSIQSGPSYPPHADHLDNAVPFVDRKEDPEGRGEECRVVPPPLPHP